MAIRFGPAGNSDSFAAAGLRASWQAPAWLRGMGLNAYEYQCGRGVHVGEETARKIGREGQKYDVALSVHAPYFINLSSGEEERREKNIQYVRQSCMLADWLGAGRVVVHCGGLGKLSREQAMENTKRGLQEILDAMEAEGYGGVRLCLETMGKQNVLGDLEEVLRLVAGEERLLPCIDFGHLHARTQGTLREQEDFARLFDRMEQLIGQERTACFHSHFSHVEYGPKGEVRHLTFADQDYGPFFAPLARELWKRGYEPVMICESAGTQAEDACQMKELDEKKGLV